MEKYFQSGSLSLQKKLVIQGFKGKTPMTLINCYVGKQTSCSSNIVYFLAVNKVMDSLNIMISLNSPSAFLFLLERFSWPSYRLQTRWISWSPQFGWILYAYTSWPCHMSLPRPNLNFRTFPSNKINVKSFPCTQLKSPLKNFKRMN